MSAPEDAFTRVTITPHALRRHAKRLRREMAAVGVTLTTAASQETMARVFGFKTFHEANQVCQGAARSGPPLTRPLPHGRLATDEPPLMAPLPSWSADPRTDAEVGQALLTWLASSAGQGWRAWRLAESSPIFGEHSTSPEGTTVLSLTAASSGERAALLTALHSKPLPESLDLEFWANAQVFPVPEHRLKVHALRRVGDEGRTPQWTLYLSCVPLVPPLPDELGMPEALQLLGPSLHRPGLWIVGGEHGSGRTTTVGAWVRSATEAAKRPVNRGKVLVFESLDSYAWDRLDAHGHHTLASGPLSTLPSACRRAPNLVVIGDTSRADVLTQAVELAQTGHGVVTAAHGFSVTAVMHRLIEHFPLAEREAQARAFLHSMQVVSAQTLLPHAEGLTAVWEWWAPSQADRHTLEAMPWATWATQIAQWMRERGTDAVTQAVQRRQHLVVSERQVTRWNDWLARHHAHLLPN